MISTTLPGTTVPTATLTEATGTKSRMIVSTLANFATSENNKSSSM